MIIENSIIQAGVFYLIFSNSLKYLELIDIMNIWIDDAVLNICHLKLNVNAYVNMMFSMLNNDPFHI